MKVVFSFSLLCCLMGLLGCASELDPQQHQTLETLPPGMQQVLQSESPEARQKFLSMPAEQRDAIVQEWQRRKQIMQDFTPAERMVISSMPPDQQDKFFALTRDQQEPFLADKAKLNNQALVNCLTLTHRRFGEFISGAEGREQAVKRFTPTEQAIISGLSREDSDKFFELPENDQEQFLTDTVKRDTEQLIACMTQSNRRLGEAP